MMKNQAGVKYYPDPNYKITKVLSIIAFYLLHLTPMKALKNTFFSLSASFFLLCLIATSCQKSVELPQTSEADPSAIFKLPFSSISSANINITGNFRTGVPLSDSERIKLKVDVIKPGNWNYKSDTINGISFSGSGILADTGQQILTLYGAGIPLAPGNILLSVKEDTALMRLTVPVLPKDTASEPVPEALYFKITIDGTQYDLTVTDDGLNQIVDMLGATEDGDTASIGTGMGPVAYPSPQGKGTISLQKGFIYDYSSATEEDFKKFFQPGSYPFAFNHTQNIGAGIIISWASSEGRHYSTFSLVSNNDQTGSFFRITGIEDGFNSSEKYFVKVKMQFRCKLYEVHTKEIKELTAGEMVTYFVKNHR